MNSKQIQESIKQSLGILMKAMKQLPGDKRPMVAMRINQVLKKTAEDTEYNQTKLQQLQKQLEFNLNFVKLSHPKLDFTPPTEEQMNPPSQPEPQAAQQQDSSQNQPSKPKPDSQKQNVHKFKVFSQTSQMEIQRLAGKDTYDQQQQLQKSVREEVSFSNWFDGNADPQQLKRHKQLLQRQHFDGQIWKDKPKPSTIAAEYLKHTLAQNQERERRGEQVPREKLILKDMKPSDIEESGNHWEKVKR